MVAITYIESNGTSHCVDTEVGTNLMEGATLNMVPGVLGLCGGICSCATCHCYVPEEWSSRIPPPDPGEQAVIETLNERRANSRLGCQVRVTRELDGLVVHLPVAQ